MTKRKREPFHHVQLTADERFREALRTQMEMERLASGRATWPAAMLPLALMEIEMRTGAELAAKIEALDLSAARRAGAVRVPHHLWVRAGTLARRLQRTSGYPASVKWSPRLTIIAALYWYSSEP